MATIEVTRSTGTVMTSGPPERYVQPVSSPCPSLLMNRESVGVRGVMGELVKPGAGAAVVVTEAAVATALFAVNSLEPVCLAAAASRQACLLGPSFGQSPFALCAGAEEARKINTVRAGSTFFILFLAGCVRQEGRFTYLPRRVTRRR
jgi:hypothetical protein